MLKNLKIIVCFLIMNLLFHPLLAQVGSEEVDVVVGYNPILGDAVKVNVQGEIPKTTSKPDTLSYNIKTDLFKVPYRPLKVNPIALPKEPPQDLDNLYVKAGFGTQTTPLLEAYFNSKQSDKYKLGIHGQYISSNGKRENQDYSDIDLGASAKFFFNKEVTMPINVFYTNDVLHYYGYDEEVENYKAIDVKQRFQNFGLNLGVENITENSLKTDYKINGGFSRISDIQKYSELNPFVSIWVKRPNEEQDGHSYGGTLLVDHYQYNGPIDYKNTIIGVKPFYNIMQDDWSLQAAFEFNVDDAGEFEPLPDVEFAKDLIGEKLVFVVGAHSYLQRNSFKGLTDENPFLGDTIDFKKSIFYEYYGGIRGSTYGNFSFNIKGYLKDVYDLSFFINDSLDLKRFVVEYSDAKMTGVNVELSYFTAGKLRIMGAVNAFTFSEIKEFEKPWHIPTLEWTLSTAYHFNKKLQAGIDIFGVNKSYALLPSNVVETIDGTVDLNFHAMYTYSKYFNIFVNLNNIAGYTYQRFFNYPSYGFQAIGGISFSF